MSNPLTKTQIAESSILDLNGRQTYLSNSFVLPMPGKQITDTTETPIVVMKNPAGSGKSLFFLSELNYTDNATFIFRYYLNPTLNVPGSPTVPLGLRSGGTTVSISTCYLAATITANGTLLYAVPAGTAGAQLQVLYILDQGSSLLVTAQQASSTTTNVYSINAWYEI